MFRIFKKKQEIKLLKEQEKEMSKIAELQYTINELLKEEREILKASVKTNIRKPRARKLNTNNVMQFIEY